MNKIRLALVIPPVIMHEYRDPGMKLSLPHIGIAYLASNVDPRRVEVIILDCPVERITIGKLILKLKQFNPNVVGLTANSFQINEAGMAAAAIKKAIPQAITLIGGYHVTPIPVETMKRFPAFDIAVHGEGELTLRHLLDTLSDSGDLSTVNGICYRDGMEIKLNPPRAFISDLDTLAFPGFHLMPMEKYRGFYNLYLFRNRVAMVSTARGCPYQCIFCHKITGSNYRVRSIAPVVEEIKGYLRDFNINQLAIANETFTINIDRVRIFCEKLIEEGISKKVRWICQSRVDLVNQEILKLMKKAGCRAISFGIESGNQDIINKIKKNLKLETALEAIRWSKQAGILTDTNFIIGHPNETIRTIKDTINFAIKLDPHLVSFSILTPFPGTVVAEMAKKGEGGLRLLTENYSMYGKNIGGALELENIPRKELEKYHRRAYLRFYMRPSKFCGLLLVTDIGMLLLMAWHMLVSILRGMPIGKSSKTAQQHQ